MFAYDVYSRAFKDFLLALNVLLNVRLTHQINDPPAWYRYLRVISYDLQKTSPNYELAFQHIYNYYAEPLVSFPNSTDKLFEEMLIVMYGSGCYYVTYLIYVSRDFSIMYMYTMYVHCVTQLFIFRFTGLHN